LVLTFEEEATIACCQDIPFDHNHHPTNHVRIDINIKILNPRLLTAHKAL
jgi:hypothetical protein